MLKKLSLLVIILASTVGFVSCGNDEDDGPEAGTTGTITVNNIKGGKILYTLCEIFNYPSYLGGDKEMILEVHFDYGDEGLMSFNVAVPRITSLSQLENGMDLTDDMEVRKFYSYTGSFIGSKNYEVLGGSAIVEKISGTDVVVKFSNFKFLRELGSNEETFTVNGTVAYEINEKDRI